MKKDVKVKPERCKSKNNFYITIYNELKKGNQIPSICKILKVERQNLNFYIQKLKKLNIIGRKDPRNHYLGLEVLVNLTETQLLQKLDVKVNGRCKSKTSTGSSGRPKTNLHALCIKFPILSGKVKDQAWEIREKLKNWIPKYKKLAEFGGLVIKNCNNKSIDVKVKARDIQNVDEARTLCFKIQTYLFDYFKVKHNVILDHLNAEVKNLDLATEDKHSESMRGKGEKYLIKFEKECEKIFPKDKRQSKAWIDGSPFKFSAETNDTEWKREYLNMPFNISSLLHSMPALDEYNKNLKLHLAVQHEMLKTLKEIQKAYKYTNTK